MLLTNGYQLEVPLTHLRFDLFARETQRTQETGFLTELMVYYKGY